MTPELKCEASFVGFAGREFLVWRQDEFERSPKSDDPSEEFPCRRHGFGSPYAAPVHQIELQKWRLRKIRRKLSKRVCGIAIFLDRLARISLERHFSVKIVYHGADIGKARGNLGTGMVGRVQEFVISSEDRRLICLRLSWEITGGWEPCLIAGPGNLS
jgi:hypothetical protein